MASFYEDIEDFLTYCGVVKQYSPNTIRNYRQTLNTAANFFLELGVRRSEDINEKHILALRKHLNERESSRHKAMAPKAQSYFVIVLRSILKYLIKENRQVYTPEKIELPKVRMRKIDFLTEIEIMKLIDVAINIKSKRISRVQKLRDRAIILTLFGSGLRLSELLKLKKYDIKDNLDGQLNILGKGGKVRTTYLAPAAIEAIDKYLIERGVDDNPYIFVTSTLRKIDPEMKKPEKGELEPTTLTKFVTVGRKTKYDSALNPKSVQNLIRKYAMYAGIDKHITPHTLRHSFATKILREGGDIRAVQTLLGHSNIATTQIYTHVTDIQIQDLHTKVFGEKPASRPSPDFVADSLDREKKEKEI
jgi:site-specific recombinase XerD